MEPGILHEVFDFLQLKVEALRSEERECCLTLDEMAIKPGVQYDVSSSCMRGDVTLPDHQGEATHALVIMIGGITTRWKQTVAYHFTGNSTDGTKLKPLILEVLQRASDIGLHVSAFTSDMGAVNRALWLSFGIVCSKFSRTINKIPHPTEAGRYLHFLADVPHIIKNMKAALVNGNDITLHQEIVDHFKLPTNTVTVKHVKILHDFQKDQDLKLAPKLTESTLAPSHFDKMKVSNALNFFSHSVSSALRYLVECEGYDKELLTTAWFLDFMNKWFDLMSSRHPVMALSETEPESYDAALSHLRSAIWIMKNMSVGKKGHWKPVQTGVVL